MLRKVRIILALLFFIGITLLFLDFTGSVHAWLGWMAKIQFLPALLALNVGVEFVLLIITFILGRVYCSIICPLGVLQDFVSWINGRRKKKRFVFLILRKRKYGDTAHWDFLSLLWLPVSVRLSLCLLRTVLLDVSCRIFYHRCTGWGITCLLILPRERIVTHFMRLKCGCGACQHLL